MGTKVNDVGEGTGKEALFVLGLLALTVILVIFLFCSCFDRRLKLGMDAKKEIEGWCLRIRCRVHLYAVGGRWIGGCVS